MKKRLGFKKINSHLLKQRRQTRAGTIQTGQFRPTISDCDSEETSYEDTWSRTCTLSAAERLESVRVQAWTKSTLTIPEQLDAAYVADKRDTHNDTNAHKRTASASPGHYSVIT